MSESTGPIQPLSSCELVTILTGYEPNAHSEDKALGGSGASNAAQAPKLRSGAHYAQWRPDMEVYLERHGAQGVHCRVMDATKFEQLLA